MARINEDSHLYQPLKYVDLLTDYGFKLVFGDKELLIAFLNALFEKEGKVVTSVKYLSKEMVSVNRHGRTIYYDVLCKTNGHEDVIIEMQHRSQDTFVERSFYYMSQSIMHQGDNKRNWDYKMYPVYGIFIMNFHLPVKDAPKQLVNEAVTVFRDTNTLLTDKFRMFFIDLLYFDAKDDSELKTKFDCWIYSIKNMGKITPAPKLTATQPFDKLYSRAEIASMNPRQYREYEASLKAYRDAYSIAKTERNARKRERAEGREEGRAEGRAEGLVEGRAEGAKAQAIETARNAKALNLPIETIVQLTGLTPEEIENL